MIFQEVLNIRLGVVIGHIIVLVTMARMMGVFYEKRSTSNRFIVLTLLCAFAVLVTVPFMQIAQDMLLIIYLVVPTFIITLNYKSLFLKRLAVVTSFYITIIVIGGLTYLFLHNFLYGIFSIDFFFYDDMSVNDIGYIATWIFKFFVISSLRLFKQLRDDAINLPKVWIPAIIFPAFYMLFIVTIDIMGMTMLIQHLYTSAILVLQL